MAWFFLTNILLISVGIILYLVIRTLPRITETGHNEATTPIVVLDRFMQSGIPERIDIFLRGLFEKILRRSKIIILKIDNVVSAQLSHIRQQGTTSVFNSHKPSAIPDPTAVFTEVEQQFSEELPRVVDRRIKTPSPKSRQRNVNDS
ncbi:MAG: hypothetical protein RIQ54_349 [Candidatus Parcubacteria bacterium]|jgi:hypothetical protein